MSQRPLGLWLLTALVAGNIIGSGIFSLPAPLAGYGSIGLLAWIFTTVGALSIALVFAKLASIMPKVGGPYAYCREAFGDFVGFQIAYSYWIGLWIGNAAIAVSLTSYLSFFWPLLANNTGLAFCVNIAIVWLLTLNNSLGIRSVGIFQLVTSILKFLPLILIAFVGLFYINPSHFMDFNLSQQSNFSAFNSVATLTAWSFLGLESASIPADSVQNPKRTIPRATILGVSIAAALYIISTIAVMGLIPLPELGKMNAPYAEAAQIILGPIGGVLVAVGAVISCVGALNGWILLQGQVPYAAARDQLFPVIFAKKSKRGIPIVGLIVSSVLVTLLLLMQFNENLIDQFTFISLLGTLITLIPYFFTTMAEILILKKHPLERNKETSDRLGSIMIAIFAGAYTFWVIVGSGQRVLFYGTLLLLSSLPAYVWMKWSSHTRKT